MFELKLFDRKTMQCIKNFVFDHASFKKTFPKKEFGHGRLLQHGFMIKLSDRDKHAIINTYDEMRPKPYLTLRIKHNNGKVTYFDAAMFVGINRENALQFIYCEHQK